MSLLIITKRITPLTTNSLSHLALHRKHYCNRLAIVIKHNYDKFKSNFVLDSTQLIISQYNYDGTKNKLKEYLEDYWGLEIVSSTN